MGLETKQERPEETETRQKLEMGLLGGESGEGGNKKAGHEYDLSQESLSVAHQEINNMKQEAQEHAKPKESI